MIKTNLFDNSDSRRIVVQKKGFSVVEYERDLSISPAMAQIAYFASAMNVRKRQLLVELENSGVYVQSGEMQMMIGDIEATTDVKGAGDLLKKVIGSAVTDESIIKPYYSGSGLLVLEPTYKYILLEDMENWPDGMVIEDGLFLAREEGVDMGLSGRRNISSTIFGREGLINTVLSGEGMVALESPVPEDELFVIELKDDILKVDGNMAIAWSPDLEFTVQKSTATLVGSLVSGEGLVNVYEGTGKVLVAPVRNNRWIAAPETNI